MSEDTREIIWSDDLGRGDAGRVGRGIECGVDSMPAGPGSLVPVKRRVAEAGDARRAGGGKE